jgi:hypothetical protein
MAGHDARTLGRKVAIAEMEIRPAHAAGSDGEQDLPGTRYGSRPLDRPERAARRSGGVDDPGPHHTVVGPGHAARLRT